MTDDTPPDDLDDPDAALLRDPAFLASVAEEEEKDRREACARLAAMMLPDAAEHARDPAWWLARLDLPSALAVLEFLDIHPDASRAVAMLVSGGVAAESARVMRNQRAARQAGANASNAMRRTKTEKRDQEIREAWAAKLEHPEWLTKHARMLRLARRFNCSVRTIERAVQGGDEGS